MKNRWALLAPVALVGLVLALIWWIRPSPAEGPSLHGPVRPGASTDPGTGAKAVDEIEAAKASRASFDASTPDVEGSPELEPIEPEGDGPRELTPNEVGDLRYELPLGVIAGLVIERGEPVDRGTVLLARQRASWTPDTTEYESDFRIPLEPDGTFEFTGLDPGSYLLGIQCRGRSLHQISLRLRPDEALDRIIVQFSGARLEGHVYDGEGRPIVGGTVCLSTDAGVPSDDYRAIALTGPDGSYGLEGLPSGSYWASMARTVRRVPWDSDTDLRITLADGETRTLDFGRAGGLPRWRGTVRLRDGRPIDGPGTLHLTHRGSSGYSTHPYSDDGTFEIRIAPGTYQEVRLQPAEHSLSRAVKLEDFLMPDRDRSEDITLPGTQLTGQLWDAKTSEPLDIEKAGNLRVSVILEGRSGSANIRRGILRADGSYRILGLTPGRWLLRSYPLRFVGMPEGGFPIEVQESDIELVFDAEVATGG